MKANQTYKISWFNAATEEPIPELNDRIETGFEYLPRVGDRFRYISINRKTKRGDVMQAIIKIVQHDFVSAYYPEEADRAKANHQHVIIYVKVEKELKDQQLKQHPETGVWSYLAT